MKAIIPFVSLVILFTACSQWRVSSLKPEKYSTIKRGNGAGMVEIRDDDSALRELTFGVRVIKNRIILVDDVLRRVQILDPDGTVRLIIGDVKDVPDPQKKLKPISFNFSVIGSVAMDRDDNIYVQNRLNREGDTQGASEGLNFSPSYILVFDKQGKLLYTLGKTGTPDLPFYYIESLDIDRYNRLLVMSRSFNTWNISRYGDKKREIDIDLSKLQFKENDGKEEYTGTIESVKMFKNGNKLLMSIAYYHNLRLKFRKIFEYNINDQKLGREVMMIPDPKNVLFNIIDDSFLYFWNTDSKNVKFMVANLDGAIMTNIMIEVKNKKSLYTDILADSGKLYSCDVDPRGIEITEWK